jgi:hypothetical protein
MASAFPVAASLETPRRPRGRPPSRSWAFFTTLAEPQKQPAATCRHCQQLVHHHKKWGQARTHLMKCAPFLRLMDTLPPQEVPEWYLAELNRRQQVAISSVPAAFQTPMPPQMAQLQVPNTAAFKSIQPMPNTAVPTTMMVPSAQMQMMQSAGSLTPKAEGQPDANKVEEAVAMHLFTTMAVGQLVAKGELEIPELARAFQLYRKDVAMPSRERLLTELLDRCFETVKRRVDGFFKSGLVPVTLTVETAAAAGQGEAQVSYMAGLASADKFPMYLESAKMARSGDDGANAEFAARDVARVVAKLACPVAGCVLPSSSSHSRQTRDLLEKQFPAMYFHGCLRDALLHLVRQLFSPAGAVEPERKRSATPAFYQDLQQFALQCKDLECFLPTQETLAYLGDTSGRANTMLHVTARRRLTAEEGFAAVLHAEPFLDADNVLDRLFGAADGSSSDGSAPTPHAAGIAHLQPQLMKIVRSTPFVDKLRKYLEVLRPLHALLSSLPESASATALPLSEVYSSLARLSRQFAASALLEPEEKGALQALVRQHQERVVGPAHLLAYLLDPVLLGEELPADTKTDVEKKLLSSFRGDGAALSDPEKEVLYAQYVDFKKAATHQKAVKAETLVFRALKERKKSSLQYWFTDGAKWPVLQAIACRVFVMPVCAACATHAAAEAGVAPRLLRGKLDPLTSDKLTYVRVNARQVQHAAACASSLVPAGHSMSDESSANDITASMVV